jgi:hypothetical protein
MHQTSTNLDYADRVHSPNCGMALRLSFESVPELDIRFARRMILYLSSDMAISRRPSSPGLLCPSMAEQIGF